MVTFDEKLLLHALNNTDSDIKELREDIAELRKEILVLSQFKWKLTGSISFLSLLITVGVNIFFK